MAIQTIVPNWSVNSIMIPLQPPNIETDKDVYDCLEIFTDQMNSAEEPIIDFSEDVKPQANYDLRRLRFGAAYDGDARTYAKLGFYLDGKHGITLSDSENPDNLGILSFDYLLTKKKVDYSNGIQYIEPTVPLLLRDLHVVQIQGPTFASRKSRYSVFPETRWPIILLKTAIYFGDFIGAHRIVVMPAIYTPCYYNPVTNNGVTYEQRKAEVQKIQTRITQRLEIPAKYLRFQRANKYSPYILRLSEFEAVPR